MIQLVKKSFITPDEAVPLPKVTIDIVKFGDMTVARARFEPGWRWSEHLKPFAGTESAQETHFSAIVAGHFHVAMDDGREVDLGPSDIATVPAGHDAWVVGDEPCISIDFQGASRNE